MIQGKYIGIVVVAEALVLGVNAMGPESFTEVGLMYVGYTTVFLFPGFLLGHIPFVGIPLAFASSVLIWAFILEKAHHNWSSRRLHS